MRSNAGKAKLVRFYLGRKPSFREMERRENLHFCVVGCFSHWGYGLLIDGKWTSHFMAFHIQKEREERLRHICKGAGLVYWKDMRYNEPDGPKI